jgi:hypothetical protein
MQSSSEFEEFLCIFSQDEFFLGIGVQRAETFEHRKVGFEKSVKAYVNAQSRLVPA